LIKEDNTIILSTQTPIMEKSNCVDEIQFITPKEYNGYDLSTFDLLLEYLLPISKTNRIMQLELIDDNYKDEYLRYVIPSKANTISGEPGTVELNLSFVKVELDVNGNMIKRVRNLSPTYLEIVPITSWFHVSDDGLSQLADLYLSNKAQIEALLDTANIINDNKADNITLDVQSGEIYLVSNDKKIGTGIKLEDLNNELVEIGGTTQGNISVIKI
jgi:hypothetical protein